MKVSYSVPQPGQRQAAKAMTRKMGGVMRRLVVGVMVAAFYVVTISTQALAAKLPEPVVLMPLNDPVMGAVTITSVNHECGDSSLILEGTNTLQDLSMGGTAIWLLSAGEGSEVELFRGTTTPGSPLPVRAVLSVADMPARGTVALSLRGRNPSLPNSLSLAGPVELPVTCEAAISTTTTTMAASTTQLSPTEPPETTTASTTTTISQNYRASEATTTAPSSTMPDFFATDVEDVPQSAPLAGSADNSVAAEVSQANDPVADPANRQNKHVAKTLPVTGLSSWVLIDLTFVALMLISLGRWLIVLGSRTSRA